MSDGREAPRVLQRVASLRRWLWKVMWTMEGRKKNPEKGRTLQTETRANAKALWREQALPAEEGWEPAQLEHSEEQSEGSTGPCRMPRAIERRKGLSPTAVQTPRNGLYTHPSPDVHRHVNNKSTCVLGGEDEGKHSISDTDRLPAGGVTFPHS